MCKIQAMKKKESMMLKIVRKCCLSQDVLLILFQVKSHFLFQNNIITFYLVIFNSNLSNRLVAIELTCQEIMEDAKYPLRSTIQVSMQHLVQLYIGFNNLTYKKTKNTM
jgi:hypothetical protein